MLLKNDPTKYTSSSHCFPISLQRNQKKSKYCKDLLTFLSLNKYYHAESIYLKKFSYSAYITAKHKSSSPVDGYIESVPPADDTC